MMAHHFAQLTRFLPASVQSLFERRSAGEVWTPPALANGLLYARNAKGDLVCLDLRKQ